MVHQSTLVVKNKKLSREIARFHKKIHEDTDRWDVLHARDGVKVSAYTYNKLNPFSTREDTIKWKVVVCCEHCEDSRVLSSECTGFSNNDVALEFLCKCKKTNIIADFCYTKCSPTVPLAIVGGAAAVAGGVAVTTLSLGLAAPIGGALIGGGMSAVCEAGAALSTGECNGASLAANIAAGAAMGAFSGGVGALGESAIKNVGSGALKLGARAAIGAVASAGSKAIGETKDCAIENKEWNKFGQAKDAEGNYTATATITSWATDTVAGAAGGAVCHANSNISKAMTGKGGLLKGATRTAVSTLAATATNAAGQGVAIATGNQKEFSTARLATTAIATATVCAAQEGAKNIKYRSHGGKHEMLKDKTDTKFIKKKIHAEKGAIQDSEVAEVKGALKTLREADGNALNECKTAAAAKPDNDALSQSVPAMEEAVKTTNETWKAAKTEHGKNSPEAKSAFLAKAAAKDALVDAWKELDTFQKTYADKEFLPNGPCNVHALHSDHANQFSCDVNGTAGNRGSERFVFDHHPDGSVLPAGYTATHDYPNLPQHGVSKGEYSAMEAQCSRNNAVQNNIAHNAAYQAVNNRH